MRILKVRTWTIRNFWCTTHILISAGVLSMLLVNYTATNGTGESERNMANVYKRDSIRPSILGTYNKPKVTTVRKHLGNVTEYALKNAQQFRKGNKPEVMAMPSEDVHNKPPLISQSLEFKKYIQLRKTRVNPNDHAFLISGEKICAKPPYLLVVCLSTHLHVEERDTIRQTWGNWSSDLNLSTQAKPLSVKLVFMLGSPGQSTSIKKLAIAESERYGDIVIMNFTDSYGNLTKKVLMSLKWVARYCKSARFIFKVDEDTFVHVGNLLNYIHTLIVPKNGIIIGHGEFKHKVLRSGIWTLNKTVYPLDEYPPYVSGNSYVISGNIVSRLYMTAEFLPYIHIEDVFVTGIVREAIGAELKHKAGFTWWSERSPRLCGFHNNDRISATNTDPSLMRRLWQAIHLNLTNCYDPTTLRKLEFVGP